MDTSGLTSLLESSGGMFAPLTFKTKQVSAHLTELHVDISQCDPESISIDVQTQGIQINAQAELSFISNEKEERSVKLSRKTHRTIPLPKGIMTQSIHSIIKNDTLILTIPLTA